MNVKYTCASGTLGRLRHGFIEHVNAVAHDGLEHLREPGDFPEIIIIQVFYVRAIRGSLVRPVG